MTEQEQERYSWAIATTKRLARSMRLPDRDDAIGEALLRFVTEILPAYNPARPFEPYATVALRRTLINTQKKQFNHKLNTGHDLTAVPAPPTSSRPEIDHAAIVRNLPAKLARLFILRYRKQMQMKQIAVELSTTPEYVKLRLHHLNKRLRALIEEKAR